MLDRIFEPFFTTKEKGKGTGLGLATVFGVAKGHGGFVQVQSQVGLGTAFEVFIPALPDAAGDTALSPASKLPAGNGQLVLVVDDEEEVRDSVVATLTENGYRAVGAADGVEATALFFSNTETFDVVVTDLQMPNMSGSTLAHTLRRVRTALPIVGMTGNSSVLERKPADRIHFSFSITKPFTVETLLNAVHQALQGRTENTTS